MEFAVTIGLDLGKSVFQVHGVDAGGAVVVQRRLTRGKLLVFFAKQPACLVGMEACAAAHHWGRELSKLGHSVRLMPPRYVKPYVKRQKNDAADAEAICEAVSRPHMAQSGRTSLGNLISRHGVVHRNIDQDQKNAAEKCETCKLFVVEDKHAKTHGLRCKGLQRMRGSSRAEL